MDRARIRWRNVGRIAGGLGAAGLLIVVAPGLLEPPEPPPLPADVGLATGATGEYAYAPAEEHASGDRGLDRERPNRRPKRDRSPGHPADGGRSRSDGSASPPRVEPDLEPPASSPTGPAPTTGPSPPAAPPPPAPPTSAPAAPPTPAPSPPGADEPAEHDAPDASPPQGPSQFGFEH